MKELEKTYNPADIEDRLYQKWTTNISTLTRREEDARAKSRSRS